MAIFQFLNSFSLSEICFVEIPRPISKSFFSYVQKVQLGYLNPNKLEIKVKDLDLNGEEVITKYDGKDYLLKLNEKGGPEIIDYMINPSEVIKNSYQIFWIYSAGHE